jgi:hypothetical protein
MQTKMKYMIINGYDDGLHNFPHLPEILGCEIDIELSHIEIFICDEHPAWGVVTLMFPNRIMDTFNELLKESFIKLGNMYYKHVSHI